MNKPAEPSARLLSAIIASPLGAQAIAAANEQRAADRKKVVNELKALDAAEDVALPKREKAYAQALAKWKEAQRAFADARVVINEAMKARDHAQLTYSGARRDLEEKLRATADNAAIDAFLDRMIGEIEWTRRNYQHQRVDYRHEVTKEGWWRVDSNAASINVRIAAINAASEAAAALRFEADQSTVPARLQVMLDELPSLDLEPREHGK